MKIFAISDLHLSFSSDKPMDVFGDIWIDHFNEIKSNWNSVVSSDDVVLVAGDISWAMSLANAAEDLSKFTELNGKKVIIRGNHDYWWSTYSKVNGTLPEYVYALQNNAIKFGNVIICGTRGWAVPEDYSKQSAEDKKIFDREVIRLRLALDEAEKLRTEEDSLIVMLHYPPYDNNVSDSVFTDLIEQHRADAVVFGHLHGKQPFYKMTVNKNGIVYHLTSCDLMHNKLKLIV